MKKGKILVTGGTGYIGSHTVVALQQKGYTVTIIDNLSNSYIEVVEKIRQITGVAPLFTKVDMSNEQNLNDFFEYNDDILAVIHFAAFKAVGESVEKPLEYYRNNVVSLLNLLENMRLSEIKNLVFSSSCAVYGEPGYVPVDERAPMNKALSPYANTKQIGESVIDSLAAVSDLQAISLRYFNPIGSHQSALIGELPLGSPNNLVPVITQSVMGKRESMFVFGTDYNTPDGTCIRDYIDVNDVANAHVVAVERLLNEQNESGHEVFNLGTGTGRSVLEVINTFEKATGKKVPYEIADRRPGDVEQVYADTSLANEKLSWKAEIPLEKSLATAWKWELNLEKQKA